MKTLRIMFFNLVMFMLVCSGTSIAQEFNYDTVQVAMDTYADETNPDNTFGDSFILRVKDSNGWNREGFIQFDYSGFDSNDPISKAILRLFCSNDDGGTILLEHMADDGWDENNVSWNNKPGSLSEGFSIEFDPAVDTWNEVDITPLVLHDLSLGTDSLITIRLQNREGSNFVEFRSKEYEEAGVTETGELGCQLLLTSDYENVSPSALFLSNNVAEQNKPIGTVVGVFSTIDPDDIDFTYELVSGDGEEDADNNRFFIDGEELLVAEIFDVNTPAELSILVQVKDVANNTFRQSFTINVIEEMVFDSIPVMHDTYGAQNSSDENFGANTTIRTKIGPGNSRYGFLKFDYSNFTSSEAITNAKLRIYCARDDGGIIRASHVADDSWDEMTLTWNNMPDASSDVYEEFDPQVDSWNELDISSLIIQDLALGNDSILSLRLTNPGGDNLVDFRTKEYEEIDVSEPGGYASQLLLSSDGNAQPFVRWEYPVNNEVLDPSATIDLVVNASDADGTISSVIIYDQNFEVIGVAQEGSVAGQYVVENYELPDTTGYQNFTAFVVDDNGANSEQSISVILQGAYLNTPQSIPGIVEMEYFDEGGQNIAYYDDSDLNRGNFDLRLPDVVDISDFGEGVKVGYNSDGEWRRYTVDVDQTGYYTAMLHYSSGSSGANGTLRLSYGENYFADFSNIGNTGGWNTMAQMTIEKVPLKGGIQELVTTIVKAGYDLDKISFEYSGAGSSPTEITIDRDNVDEMQQAGTLVGSFAVVDPDDGDAHNLTLVAGDGINDSGNGAFYIDGNQLYTDSVFDHSVHNTYNLFVRAEDMLGYGFEKEFVIIVNDNPSVPQGLTLDNNSVEEGLPQGTTVGAFSVIDEDDDKTYTFSIDGGFADNDNFIIDGNELKTNVVLGYNEQSSHLIYITASDNFDQSVSEMFEIEVLYVNKAPTEIFLSNTEVVENQSSGVIVGVLTAEDVDDTEFSYALVAGDGINDADNNKFSIIGDQLFAEESFSVQEQQNLSVLIQVTDGAGNTFSQSFSIDVTVGTSTGDVKGNERVQVFPNPISDFLYLNNYHGRVIIRSLSGKKVIETYVFNQRINCSSLQSGYYLVELVEEGLVVKVNVE